MNTIYYYCVRCGKPLDREPIFVDGDKSLELCKACATELYKKIYGEEQKP